MMLTKEQVKQIKIDLTRGELQRAVAAKFNVTRSAISDIATNRRHKDVPWPDTPPVKKRGGQKNLDYDPTDERVRELESEVLHLREERDLARRAARDDAKKAGLFQAMTDELKSVKPFKSLPPQWRGRTKGEIDEHLVLHLSDGHFDQIVSPEECGGLETYNFPIACRRAETYVDTVLDWTQQTLAPRFRFSALTILAYGDFTSGEIHGHTNRSYFRNQFHNCFAIGQLLALMFRDLAPYFETVNVVFVPGNHGRRSKKKDYHGALDNWDYLVAEIAKQHCHDLDNVGFLIPNAFSINLDINGVGFHIFHGDDIRGSLGLPYYGLQRRQRSLIALADKQVGPRIRYFCCGHFHKPGSIGDMDGEMIVNGPWLATDAYAYNSFSGYTEPSQLMHGVNPKHGVTWKMQIHLRTPGEENGPTRYKIDLG